MKVKKDDAKNAVYGDNPDFTIVKDEIVDHRRWSVVHKCILQHNFTKKFYSVGYRVGATEYQEESPFEYEDEVEFIEVVPVEKTVIVYEVKK